MPVKKRPAAIGAAKRVVNAPGANRRAHRQEAAGQPFRQAHDVRHHAGQLARKHAPAAAEAGQHLIGDQQHVIFAAEPPHALQKFHRMHDHSARALQQRLDDQRGDLAVCCFQQPLSGSTQSMSQVARIFPTGQRKQYAEGTRNTGNRMS